MISIDNLKTTLNAIKCLLTDYPKKKDIPTKLPNPNPLTFTGAVTGSYDGSEALTVEISSGGGGGSVPKPLTYDYMPEGYPTKATGAVTLMEEQEVAFTSIGSKGLYGGNLTTALEVVEGQKYTVNWDGAEYECVCSIFNTNPVIGNLSIAGGSDNTGEPFLYVYIASQSLGQFGTLDTSASHTISVKKIDKTVTLMAEEFLPATALITADSDVGTLSSNLTNDELYERLLGGRQVVLYLLNENEYLYLMKWKKNSSGRIDLFFNEKNIAISLLTDGTIGPTPRL